MSLAIKYRLWVIMMCQCEFTALKKCAFLAQKVDGGGVHAFVKAEGNSKVLFVQLCCDPKPALKKYLF